MLSSQSHFVFAMNYATLRSKHKMGNVTFVLADFRWGMADGIALPKTKCENNKLDIFFLVSTKRNSPFKSLAMIIIFLADSMTESGHHDVANMIHEVMKSSLFAVAVVEAKNEPLPKIDTCTIWHLIEAQIHSHQRKVEGKKCKH